VVNPESEELVGPFANPILIACAPGGARRGIVASQRRVRVSASPACIDQYETPFGMTDEAFVVQMEVSVMGRTEEDSVVEIRRTIVGDEFANVV
jgi:hypothetical protein